MILAALAAAVAAPAPAAAPPAGSYIENVRRAALELCPRFARAELSKENLPAFTEPAFHRVPGLEEEIKKSSKGRDVVVLGGMVDGKVVLLVSESGSGHCQVTLKGSEAADGLASIRSALDAPASGYAPGPKIGNPGAGFPNGLVYRSIRGPAPLTLHLYKPSADDASQSYVIEVELAD